MKKLGNVLYIMTENSYLYCQNETIAVKIGGKDKVRIPAHIIESIICLENTTVSTPLIGFCSEHGISLSFHSNNGKFYGRIYGSINGNVLLRKKQYNLIHEKQSESIVRNILSGKFANSRNILLKSARDNDSVSAEKLRRSAKMISQQHNLLLEADSIDSMRGIEGSVANIYFNVFDCMLKINDDTMQFVHRSRRPPENRVNAMLSFTYMLLKNDIQSALESVGLDPAAGYLHTLRPGRPSLALDVMEELRSPLCDRFVISLINLKQIQSDDFTDESGEYNLTDKARRLLIDKWQQRKKTEITHLFLNEKIPIGLIPYCQAMLLARYMRGDIDEYPPFVWR
jgi:CRISPR-associated protein Cas1